MLHRTLFYENRCVTAASCDIGNRSRDLARTIGLAVRKISRAILEEAAYAATLSHKHFLKRDAVFF